MFPQFVTLGRKQVKYQQIYCSLTFCPMKLSPRIIHSSQLPNKRDTLTGNSQLMIINRNNQPGDQPNKTTNFSIVLDKKSRYRRIHHRFSNQDECSKLVGSIVGTGKYIYINVLGEKDEDIVRPITVTGRASPKASNEGSVHYLGASTTQLSKQEKVTLEYVNSELRSNDSFLKAKQIMINKFFNAERSQRQNIERGEIIPSRQHSRNIIRRRRVSNSNASHQLSSENNLEIRPFLTSRQALSQNFSNLLCISNSKLTSGAIKCPPKPTKKVQNRYSLLHQTHEQSKQFMAQHQSVSSKRDRPIHANPTDKYDMNFSSYLHRKLSHRIQKQYSERLQSIKKHNIVDEYQDHEIRNVLLSQKNKDFALKRFDQINRERRRLKL